MTVKDLPPDQDKRRNGEALYSTVPLSNKPEERSLALRMLELAISLAVIELTLTINPTL